MFVGKIPITPIYSKTPKAAEALNTNGQRLLETASHNADEVSLSNEVAKSLDNVSNAIKHANITYNYNEGGTVVFGYMPDYYIRKVTEFVPEQTVVARFGPNKGQTKTIPAHSECTQYLLPHYHIDKLWTGGKGTGTTAVQSVVRKSVHDPNTIGRVTLDACCIDGKTSPAGFYYKLGFRFKDPILNQELETWIQKGGQKENAPHITGIMYLPKENINHCLNYGKNL